MQSSDFWTRTTSLYGSQPSPVVLCMQNNVISTSVTSLYGPQPSPVVIACKRATFGPELQVSMCPRPHLSFCACKTLWLAPELLVFMGPSPNLWLLHAKQRLLHAENHGWVLGPIETCNFSPNAAGLNAACLASEWLVSMDTSPHLWFLHAKQRLLDPNNKSLWVPDITCRFVHAIQRD